MSGEAVKAERAAEERGAAARRGGGRRRALEAEERPGHERQRAAEAEAENARLRDVVKARDETLAAAEAAVAEGPPAPRSPQPNATLEAAVQKLKATAGAPPLPSGRR